VIGLLCSDWSDGPVWCDWSTLLWNSIFLSTCVHRDTISNHGIGFTIYILPRVLILWKLLV